MNIRVLAGDNFYGQKGKRGEDYRKITLSPNAETLDVSKPSQTEPSTTTTPGQKVQFPSIPYYVEYYSNGRSSYVKGYKVIEKNNYTFMAISREQSELLKTPIFAVQTSRGRAAVARRAHNDFI